MKYHFDSEGVSMKWGLLFKKEVNLTYSRIQDIHLISGIIQRWLGLADIKIQTASGNAEAEMTIEGLTCSEELRDFLYSKMRGTRNAPANAEIASREGISELELLREIRDELSKVRHALEKLDKK
jgi:putative membrane protein